ESCRGEAFGRKILDTYYKLVSECFAHPQKVDFVNLDFLTGSLVGKGANFKGSLLVGERLKVYRIQSRRAISSLEI
ncbi:hypothetical protein, partial [Allocoleopsis sp.]|uniref:hypothetical protein n=1 Tax=Allocoleopsis sp. TaxID=3088169 RepID=UPI002FD21DFC